MFEKLGRFEIKGILGRGAMGEVYLGVDASIGREVAIKTILPSSSQGEEAKQRFAREARAAGVLNHPNIVTIYEFGEDQGVLFIAMERVKGQDLEELMRLQGLSNSEALEVLAQVCDGLEFAHDNGIIHRDIKPSNVRVLRDGRRLHAKVMDFGVARLSNSEMTATGTVVGTVSYMAPEYISTGKPDARSDLFAVGVMLYESISGRKPFDGDTTPTILYKIVHQPPDPIELSHMRDVSPAIRMVLDRALAKDPAQRYGTAEELARALRAAKDPTWQGHVDERTVRLDGKAEGSLRTEPAAAHAEPTVAIQTPATRRLRIPLIASAAGLFGLLALGFGFLWRQSRVGHANDVSTEFQSSSQQPTGSDPGKRASIHRSASGTPSKSETPDRSPKNPSGMASLDKTAHRSQDPTPEPKSEASTRQEAYRSMPAQERQNRSHLSFGEAIAFADSNPQKALEGLREALAANPSNANAYAWTIAILYEQGRYAEIPNMFVKARENGVDRFQMANNIRFRMAMQNDRLNRRIPWGSVKTGVE